MTGGDERQVAAPSVVFILYLSNCPAGGMLMTQSRSMVRCRRAFTLIELLVVIAIIAILIGLLLKPESGGGTAFNFNYRTSSYRAVSGATTKVGDGNAFWDIGGGPPSIPQNFRGPLHVVNVAGLQQESLVKIIDGTSNTLLIG